MSNRVVKIVLVVAALAVTLVAGAIVGGGAVYLLTRHGDRHPSLHLGDGGLSTVHVDSASAGALIVDVTTGGPADDSGLRAGDLVSEVDGRALSEVYDLRDAVADHKPGDEVTLRVARSGASPRDVVVTLGEHPEESGLAYLGVEFWQLGGGRERVILAPHGGPGRNWVTGGGVLVVRVEPGGPADEAGLAGGDVIVAADGVEIEDPAALVDAIAALDPGDEVMLTVRDIADDGDRSVSVTLGEHPDDAGKAYLGVRLAPAAGSWRFSPVDPERFPRRDGPQRRFEFHVPRRDLDDGVLEPLREWFRSL